MIRAQATYDQLKTAKSVLGARFLLIYVDDVDAGVFKAAAVSDQNLALVYEGTKPQSFTSDFSGALRVADFS